VYSIVVINTICAQFFDPARMALIGDIVPEPQRAGASGLSQTVRMLAMVLAPPIAPILYVATGAEWAIGINALSFIASFLFVAAVRAPKAASSVAAGQQPNFLREFGAGLRFSFGNRIITTLIVTVTIIMFGASAINALDLFFVLGPLHTSVSLYGLLTAAMGIGAVVGSILAGTLAQRVGLVRTLNISLLLTGIGILVYSRLTSFWPAVAAMSITGIFMAALNVPVGPLLLRITPREMVGRVAATINPMTGLASMLGTVLAGFLASEVLANLHVEALGMAFGPIDTIFTGGAIIAILGALYSIARLGLRDPAPLAPPAAPTAMEGMPPLIEVGVPETITAG
jgi:MFS family permease